MRFGTAALERLFGARTPVVLQAEHSECALACLAMVATRYGHRVSLTELRHRYAVSLKGARLDQLMNTARNLDLVPRAVRVDLDDLAKLRLPAMLHWNFDHYVVLTAIGRRGAVIHDPALGRRRCSRDHLSKHFTGVAVELTPTDDFRRARDGGSLRMRDLWSGISGLGTALAQLAALSLLVQVCALVAPFHVQWVVDEGLVRGDLDLITALALGFLLVHLVNAIGGWLRDKVVLYLGASVSLGTGQNLFRHVMSLPVPFFDRRHLGDVLSRFGSLEAVERTLSVTVVTAVIDGCLAIGTLTLMFIYSPTLTVAVLILTACYLVARSSLVPLLKQRNEVALAADARQESTFIESVRNIRALRLFGRESVRVACWSNDFVEALNARVGVQRLEIHAATLRRLLIGIDGVLIVFLGARQVLEGTVTVGMMFAFLAYRTHFREAILSLADQTVQLRLLVLHLARIADLALAPTGPVSTGFTLPVTGRLRCEAVSFSYPGDRSPVLRNVHLDVAPGEAVALIGQSGSGKSTLLKLLLGLMPPDNGSISIDGYPLNVASAAALRGRIGVVMQDDQLFSGTLSENITLFDESPDPARIEKAATTACVHDDILRMPMGYQSRVGEMGGALSAGQQQRVLIARAVYRDPALLLLDEGTANLDSPTTERVLDGLAGLGITRIFVTHDALVAAKADRRLVLHDGQLHVGDDAANQARLAS